MDATSGGPGWAGATLLAAMLLTAACGDPTEAPPATVTLTAVEVQAFPAFRPNGGPWDPPDGFPDLTLALVDGEGRPVLHTRDRPFVDQDGPVDPYVRWTFDGAVLDATQVIRIELYDEDEGGAPETIATTEGFVPQLPRATFLEPIMVVEGTRTLRVRLEFRRD